MMKTSQTSKGIPGRESKAGAKALGRGKSGVCTETSVAGAWCVREEW